MRTYVCDFLPRLFFDRMRSANQGKNIKAAIENDHEQHPQPLRASQAVQVPVRQVLVRKKLIDSPAS